ncbi:MAG: hypothetical protein ACTSR8_00450 [Promethearchaeota archaeon]
MINLVFDACSLIYLTKIGIKEKLPSLGNPILIRAVKEEIIVDIDKFDDAKIIKSNLDKQIIHENLEYNKKLPQVQSLGLGEKATIEFCLDKGGIPVTDDHKALNYAISVGLRPKTSEVILLDFLKIDVISIDDFKRFFKELAVIKALKPEIVDFFNEEGKKIMKNKDLEKENKKYDKTDESKTR